MRGKLNFRVYTDASYSEAEGRSGIAALFDTPDVEHGKIIVVARVASKHHHHAELQASCLAVRFLARLVSPGSDFDGILYSDSKYAITALNAVAYQRTNSNMFLATINPIKDILPVFIHNGLRIRRVPSEANPAHTPATCARMGRESESLKPHLSHLTLIMAIEGSHSEEVSFYGRDGKPINPRDLWRIPRGISGGEEAAASA